MYEEIHTKNWRGVRVGVLKCGLKNKNFFPTKTTTTTHTRKKNSFLNRGCNGCYITFYSNMIITIMMVYAFEHILTYTHSKITVFFFFLSLLLLCLILFPWNSYIYSAICIHMNTSSVGGMNAMLLLRRVEKKRRNNADWYFIFSLHPSIRRRSRLWVGRQGK